MKLVEVKEEVVKVVQPKSLIVELSVEEVAMLRKALGGVSFGFGYGLYNTLGSIMNDNDITPYEGF